MRDKEEERKELGVEVRVELRFELRFRMRHVKLRWIGGTTMVTGREIIDYRKKKGAPFRFHGVKIDLGVKRALRVRWGIHLKAHTHPRNIFESGSKWSTRHREIAFVVNWTDFMNKSK